LLLDLLPPKLVHHNYVYNRLLWSVYELPAGRIEARGARYQVLIQWISLDTRYHAQAEWQRLDFLPK
jgi:hypothetical protein